MDYVADAMLTFDMKHLDGSIFTSADITARTCAVLKDRFASICTIEEALARAV